MRQDPIGKKLEKERLKGFFGVPLHLKKKKDKMESFKKAFEDGLLPEDPEIPQSLAEASNHAMNVVNQQMAEKTANLL